MHLEERDKEKLKNAVKGRFDKNSEKEKLDEQYQKATRMLASSSQSTLSCARDTHTHTHHTVRDAEI